MLKEEKLKIIATVDSQFDEISSHLNRLEEIEDAETKATNSEVDYSQIVTSARGTLAIFRDYFNWYKATVDERD